MLLLDPHTGFSRGRWGGLVFPYLQEFSTVCCDPHTQRLWCSQWNRIDVFLEFPCFFYDPTDVGNLISGSSAFSKPSCTSGSSWFTYCWSLAWRILNITLLVWKWAQLYGSFNIICHCPSLDLEWNWPFPVLWPLLSFSNLLACWVQHFHSIIF